MDSKKTLFIVRHGKSTWDYHGIEDIDRPLKERGIQNAYDTAGFLKDQDQLPEMIYTSPATRAFHTAIIFARVLNFSEDKLFVKNDLYMANVDDILQVIAETSSRVNSLMIFGHNPGFTDITNYLSELSLSNLPTSGLVMLTFASEEWKDINRSNLISAVSEFPNNY